MRRLVRWIFLVGPCRLYLAGEAAGGAVPWSFMGGLLGTAAAAGGLGALTAVVVGADPGDYFTLWALGGLGAVAAWAVYSAVVLVVLWLAGRSPKSIRGVLPESEASGREDP